jgi:hypothetical protein
MEVTLKVADLNVQIKIVNENWFEPSRNMFLNQILNRL